MSARGGASLRMGTAAMAVAMVSLLYASGTPGAVPSYGGPAPAAAGASGVAPGVLPIPSPRAASGLPGRGVAVGPLVPVADSSTDLERAGSLPGIPEPGAVLDVDVTLRLSNQSALDRLLAGLSEPASPEYHRFLSSAQFDTRYSPTAAEYRAAVAYFASFGVANLTLQPDRVSIEFRGSPAQVGSAFHTSIRPFSIGGTEYLAPSAGPRLPAALAADVAEVAGLGTYPGADSGIAAGGLRIGGASPVPSSPVRPAASGGYLAPVTINGSQFEYVADFQVAYGETPLFATYGYPTGVDLATILWPGEYLGPTGPTPCGVLSNGQPVGPFVPADIYAYYNETLPAAEPRPHIVAVPLNGAPSPGPDAACDGTGANGENTVDLETAGAMAPGATVYNVYGTAGTDVAFADILSPPASLPMAERLGLANVSVISNSWGSEEYNDTSWFTSLEQAQARGITVLACSGDSDDNDGSSKYLGSTLWFPASMAYGDFGDVAVGGTTVTLAPATLAIRNETTWNISAADTADGGPVGSTGGLSGLFPEPVWQRTTEANAAIEAAGGTERGDPDLAALANATLFTITVNGTQYRATNASVNDRYAWGWGTSISSPLVAGLLAEIDHVLGRLGRPPLGFLDPTAYSIANAARSPGAAPTPFRDVTSGGNYRYRAQVGYDLATGWGSLEASNFTELLVGPAATVRVVESGLPPSVRDGKGWTAEIGGVEAATFGTEINFTEPVGAYPYLFAGPPGYRIAATGPGVTWGNLSVSGAETVAVRFSRGSTDTLRFRETGISDGAPWCVELRGESACTAGPSLVYRGLTPAAAPDWYAFAVLSPLGGQEISFASGRAVELRSAGAAGALILERATRVSVRFSYPYAVTFDELGATGPANWSVTVRGRTIDAPLDSPIRFDLSNGSYSYRVGAIRGYESRGAPRPARVGGGPVTVAVTFVPTRRSAAPREAFGPPPYGPIESAPRSRPR